jgi:S1-C subfamily serine protease
MHASEVLVQRRQGGDQFAAKITAIAPTMDLALIELKDPAGLEGISPLSLADSLPQSESRISVYGYPKGGSDLSVTNGIVSRIEIATYNFGVFGLRVQIDAALNPGNSGGPAVQDGKIAGIVYSKIQQAETLDISFPPTRFRTS